MSIGGWDNQDNRSVATVKWSKGNKNVYRVGYKGWVDLSYIEEAAAGTYYKEHLPLLTLPLTIPSDNSTNETASRSAVPAAAACPPQATFNDGDKVKVMVDVETLKEMQEGHGGWNPRMAQYIGKIGRVHRITDKGNVRVEFEGCHNRWTFHPGALTKVTSKDTFSLGHIVRVKTDLSAVKLYQRGHGEWTDVMKNVSCPANRRGYVLTGNVAGPWENWEGDQDILRWRFEGGVGRSHVDVQSPERYPGSAWNGARLVAGRGESKQRGDRCVRRSFIVDLPTMSLFPLYARRRGHGGRAAIARRCQR